MKLLGEEELDGKKYYKINVKNKSGNIETYYINANTFLIDRYVGIYNIDGAEIRNTANLQDYVKTDGYVVPY